MPVQKAAGITAKIGVDTVDARANINQLKRAIRQANQSFRDTANAQRAAGNSTKALLVSSDGLKDRIKAIRTAIDDLNEVTEKAEKAQETGTKNYHHAKVDLQQLKVWLESAKHSLQETSRALTFHNEKLRESVEQTRHNKQANEELINQYKAEGNAIKANNQTIDSRKQHIRDLNGEIEQYRDTLNKADNDPHISSNNPDYHEAEEQLQEAITKRAELRREIALDDSNLKQLEQDEDTEKARQQSLNEQYQAEHRSVDANNQSFQTRIEKLNRLYRLQHEINVEMKRATSGPNNYDGTAHVEALKRKMYELQGTAARTKSELNDMGSGIPTLTRYNELYNESVNKVVQRLKNLKGSAQAGREEFRLLSRNIYSEGKALDYEKQRLSEVAKANVTAKDSTGHLSIAYQREHSKMESLNSTYHTHMQRIRDLSEGYGQLSKKGAASLDHLTDKIRANDHAAHNDLRTAHALTNGSIALGMGFYYGAKQATTLQHEFNKVGVLAHNSGEKIGEVKQNVRGMGSEAVDMSEKFGVSQQKISQGFEQLIRRGYSSGQAMKAMPAYLKAATASGEDLGDVINSAGSALEGFGLKNKNIGKNTKVVTNEMAAGADYTATSFKDMAYSMSYVGPIAKQTNQSVSETSSALGVLANNGIKGSMAGTSLRKVLQNIAGFKPNNKVLKSLGLTPKDFQDSKGNLLDISTIMGKLHDKMKNLSGAKKTNIMQQLFGRTGSQSAQVLTDNANAVASLDKKVSHATQNGYTSKTSRQNMKTTEGQLLRLKAAGTQLAREYAEGLMPVFSHTADAAITLSKGLSHLPTGMKTIVAGATLAVPAFAGLAYILATARKATSVYLQLKRHGWSYFVKSNSELKLNSGYYQKHTDQLNTDTEALRNNQKAIQDSISLNDRLNGNMSETTEKQQANTESTTNNTDAKTENAEANNAATKSEYQNTGADDENAGAERTDATATDQANAAKEAGAATGGSGEASNVAGGVTSGKLASTAGNAAKSGKLAGMGSRVAAHTPVKSGLAMGAIVGGTEAMSGQPKQGAEDGAGTTAGMIGGGALGAALVPVAPEVGAAIGGTIGSVAGPQIARSVGNAGSKLIASHNSNKHSDTAPGSKSYQQSHPDSSDPLNNTPYEYPRKGHKAPSASQELHNTPGTVTAGSVGFKSPIQGALKGLTKSAQNFADGEARLERHANMNFIHHSGRMTNAQKGYYRKMYAGASGYIKNREKQREADLKAVYKEGGMKKSTYNRDIKNLKGADKTKLSTLRKDESNIEKTRGKSRKKRMAAIKKYNNDLTKLASRNGKKRNKLLAALDRRGTKLSAASYARMRHYAYKQYQDAKDRAYQTYQTKKSANKKSYDNAVDHLKHLHSTHSSAYKREHHALYEHLLSQDGKAKDSYNKRKSDAQKEHDKVISAANSETTKAIRDGWKKKTGVVKALDGVWDDITDSISSVKNKVTGLFHHKANGTPDTYAVHLALGNMGSQGGRLTGVPRTEMAVVNDGGGRELMRMPNGQMVLPSGRNVHTILPKGTSVFNAGQTRQILGAINQPAVHHAAGTVGETPLAGGTTGKSSAINVKTPQGSLNQTAKSTKKSMKNIHDVLDKGYKKTAKDVQSHLDDLHDSNHDSWDDNYKITKKRSKKIHDDTVDRYGDMKDSINDMQKRSNQLTGAHLDTTVSYFRHHFAMIPPISRSSMKAGINNINAGISSIDGVLAQFGGNSHVLGAVHYATGTSTPSMEKQLAILNDATSGPQQEAVVSDSGRVKMPHGRNVPMMLNPGDKVLNGSDTLRALKTGLIPHYAGGLHSTDALRSLAKRYSKAPTSFTNNTFNRFARAIGSVLARGLTTSTKGGAQKPANAWSNAMWKYIDTLINPDNSVLLQRMHELGDGRKYSWGGNGPSAYDCSGLVHAALSALHIASPRLAGQFKDIGKVIPRSEAGPGDIVESAKHVGVVDSQGAKSYFSAYNQHVHPNILSQPLDNAHFTPGNPFWFVRIPQLGKYNREEQEVQSNPLTPRVKHQLGTRASDWIYKNLGESGGAGMTNGHGALAQIWNAFAKHGMTAKQIAGVMGSIWQEDSSFRSDQLGYDGSGLGFFQITPGSLLKSWAARHGRNWRDPATQADCYYSGWLRPRGFFSAGNGSVYDEAMAGARIEAGGIGDSLPGNSMPANRVHGAYTAYNMFAHSHGKSVKGYRTGGLSMADKMAHISEGNKPEMVLPLTNRSRAVELMLKSLEYMFGDRQNQNQKKSVTQQPATDSTEQLRDRKFEQDLIQSNRNKDKMIQNMLNKITVLIKVVQDKPVLSTADIYKANRHETQKKARLRNFNLGTF